jgi:hypothetical protein
LADLYDFRNIIAHGQGVPQEPYGRDECLWSTEGNLINYSVPYNRSALMREASVFMLSTALRRVFVEGLFNDVQDPARWRAKMTLYEHRYKDSGGPPATKVHGR